MGASYSSNANKDELTRRINRFVSETLPAEGSSQGWELQSIEQQHSLDQATAIFKKERNEVPSLRDACNMAESLLSNGHVGQNLGSLYSLSRDSKVAIVAFTLESPNVYMDFNSSSRSLTASSWSSFPYKGLWLLLNKAILSHGQLNSSITVTRGMSAVINPSPNTAFCFRQITSTSSKNEVGNLFSNGQGTLFIINIKRGLSIKALSKFPNEDEYVLPAFDKFVVTKVENTGGVRKIYLQG